MFDMPSLLGVGCGLIPSWLGVWFGMEASEPRSEDGEAGDG